MKLLNKIRWRLEKYLFDPMVNFYLQNRVYERQEDQQNIECFIHDKNLKKMSFSHLFQGMITASKMKGLYEENFSESFERGMKNDPINYKQKELLRFRVFINTMIAKIAGKNSGDFCTVGVSWGGVPRTIWCYLNREDFWKKVKNIS